MAAHSLSDVRHLDAPDGTAVAYWVRGRGPEMVLTNGVTTTTNFWSHLQPRWERSHRVLSWDLPGHGASAPARSDACARLPAQPDLLVRLMDAAGMKRSIQVGWSTGCQVVLEMYRRRPERCAALVLILGAAGRVLSTAGLPLPGAVIDLLVRRMPRPIFGGLTRALARIAHAPGGQLAPRAFGLIGKRTTQRDAALITEHLCRIDTRTVQTMIASAHAHSAWDVLPAVAVPTLIVAGDRDPFAPAATVGVPMHASCPGSELLRLPEGTHTAMLDHAGVIGDALDDFLRRRVET
jgi:pimeloyl-ACP methyl ester carboxylesterase